jgi:hypothetical protein
MHIKDVMRNKPILGAIASGLCAVIAAYMAISIIAEAESARVKVGKKSKAVMTDAKSKNTARSKVGNGYVIAPLATSDFALLNAGIKEGTRINVIGVDNTGSQVETGAHTILADVEVVGVCKGEANSVGQDSGFLVLLTSAESERLFSFSKSGSLRVAISGKSAKW